MQEVYYHCKNKAIEHNIMRVGFFIYSDVQKCMTIGNLEHPLFRV